MKRRKFLTAASLATTGILVPIGLNSWAAQGLSQSANPQRLVVVLLRGGVDGLNLVVPHQETNYYSARPTIAIPYPQEKNGVLDLDSFFGLHPHLKDLMPLWQQKSLAFVHASGLPIVERSHFQAQDYIENGTPGFKNTPDGWMNRLLAQLPQEEATQALNVGVTTPYILKGKMNIASLRPGKNSTGAIPTDHPFISKAFDELYGGTDDLSKAYQEGRKVREKVLAALSQEMKSSSRQAKNVNAFADDADEVAKLMVGSTKTQLAFMDIGGWDSHVNESVILDRLLPSFGEGLATLVKGLEPIYTNTVIVVLSEFGRTLKENGTKGTDHGYGNVMMLLGGRVRGGKVYGEWKGLDEPELDEDRDLAVTTDYREIIAHVLQNHLSVADNRLSQVFPNFKPTNKIDFLS